MNNLFPTKFTLENGKELIVRQAEERDSENLLAFTQEILMDDEFYVTTLEDLKEKLTIEQMTERIQKHLNQPNWCYLVAELEGHIVGQIHLRNGHRKRIEHVCWLAINVLKECRELGIGSALMETAIAWAKDNAVIEKLTLGVFADNEVAKGLYRKMGFREEGRKIKEVKFGPDRYKDSILMYRFVK
jgi:RimJ/RimL family protein N-acetyltransferase